MALLSDSLLFPIIRRSDRVTSATLRRIAFVRLAMIRIMLSWLSVNLCWRAKFSGRLIATIKWVPHAQNTAAFDYAAVPAVGLDGVTRGQAESDFKVTLLGTGTPIPYPDRSGPSTLVEAGNQKLLFDAGRGVPVRLKQINVPLGKIDALFLTHYHSDHTAGIPDLWLSGWLPGSWARRNVPFRVVGPVGAKSLMANLEKAYAFDIKIRLEDEKLPPEGIATAVEEFEQDGVVYDKDGVKVIAFTVDHGAAIKPAVGYRIEYRGRSVVISGDTRYDQNVIKYGTGADVLIHEVCIVRPELVSNIFIQRIIAHHTSPREAGQVFSLAKPKLAAYTHLVFLANDKVPAASVDDIVVGTRETYGGPLEVGEDLMSFEIGDTITVRRYKP